MANEFIKATKVVNAGLGVLAREVVLPSLVWRDAGGNFAGARDDTISLRVPAYTNARTRTLRTGTITTDNLEETKVDVTLETDVYKGVAITDEELTLDITDFGVQILNPCTSAVARGVEDAVVSEMQSAQYAVGLDADRADPWETLIDARVALNNANVPMEGRVLACGSGFEADLLKSDRLSTYQLAGSSDVLREATIGRIAGFTAISVPGLDPDWAIAFHRTAFVLSMQAPAVPDGVSWGSTGTYNGFAMRVLKDYDFGNVRDRFLANVFVGTSTVKDHGVIDGNGKFQPNADEQARLVRAVKVVRTGGS